MICRVENSCLCFPALCILEQKKVESQQSPDGSCKRLNTVCKQLMLLSWISLEVLAKDVSLLVVIVCVEAGCLPEVE